MASQLSNDVGAIRAGRRWSDRQLQGGEITTADVNSGSASTGRRRARNGWSPAQNWPSSSDGCC